MGSEAAAGWPVDAWTAALLTDLQHGGYTPAAWALFLACSWRRARETAWREPLLVRSLQHLSLAIAAGSALPLAYAARRHGPRKACHMGGLLVAGLAWQQANAYVHLGLNRRLCDGVLEVTVGPAIGLSYLRGTVAHWLWAAAAAGILIPGLEFGALVVGALTDALDGPVARRGRRATKLGAYADGEADLVLATALILAAVRRGTLPAGACGLVAARYAFPVGVAFATACVRGQPPAIEHTLPGRLCGVAQAGLLASALAPRRVQPRDGTRHLLLGITAVLSVASGVVQVLRVVRPGRQEGRPR